MDFSDLREEIEEFEVSKPLANRWILKAIDDFCRKTFMWREWQTFLTVAGQRDYTLNPSDSNTKVVGIMEDAVEFSTVDTPSPSASDSTTAGALTAGNTYAYKVTATTNDHGETLPCDAVSHVCPATKSIDLSWTAVDDADGYNVYRNDGAGGTTYGLLESITTNSYTDDGDETPTTSSTPPTKSNLVKQIKASNQKFEKGLDRYWKTRESDWVERVLWDGDVTLTLDVVPETANMGFQVEVALTMTSQTTIPDILIPYKEALVDFIRGEIYLHPKTDKMPWHDKEMAMYHRKQYRIARTEAKMEVIRRHAGSLRARGQTFA